MKIKILKDCQDKETKQNFKAGQVIDHKRGKEIISKGYAEAITSKAVVEEIEVKAEEVKPKRKRKAKAK